MDQAANSEIFKQLNSS